VAIGGARPALLKFKPLLVGTLNNAEDLFLCDLWKAVLNPLDKLAPRNKPLPIEAERIIRGPMA
jgi:hypothetical protein